MATIVGAALTSHAFTFLAPETWDKRRGQIVESFTRRYGRAPEFSPDIDRESSEENLVRYKRIRDGLDAIKSGIEELKPDAVIVIGDDQNENYVAANLPQFALYTGESLVAKNKRTGEGRRYRCDAALSAHLATALIEDGIDLVTSATFTDDAMISHAHREPLTAFDPDASYAVVPLFINAINVPAPTPKRCYDVGVALGRAIASTGDDKRIVLISSGGFSHFSGGYPWKHYHGTNKIGSIEHVFDREMVVANIVSGNGGRLGSLTSSDLLENGQVELRQSITMLGAIGDVRPDFFTYEPFHRGIMGMATGFWHL